MSRAARQGADIAWPILPEGRFTSVSKTRNSPRSGSTRQTRSIAPPSARRSILLLRLPPCPNAVTDEMLVALRKHWTEEQIVEIVGVIALFGFLNRWNDTLATPLEDEPIEVGQKYLARGGWTIGKHHR